MSNRTVPNRIVRMVRARMRQELSSTQIAKAINSSATAHTLSVKYTPRAIAAVMANVTRGNYVDLA